DGLVRAVREVITLGHLIDEADVETVDGAGGIADGADLLELGGSGHDAPGRSEGDGCNGGRQKRSPFPRHLFLPLGLSLSGRSVPFATFLSEFAIARVRQSRDFSPPGARVAGAEGAPSHARRGVKTRIRRAAAAPAGSPPPWHPRCGRPRARRRAP